MYPALLQALWPLRVLEVVVEGTIPVLKEFTASLGRQDQLIGEAKKAL